MAITFYGAKVLDSGAVKDNKFVQFNIPIIQNYRTMGDVRTDIAPNFRSEATIEHADTDAVAIDWCGSFLRIFGRTVSNDNSDLIGQKITFFNSNNVNSNKLGFTMKLAYVNGNEYRFVVGREENGIGIFVRFDASNNAELHFYQNPRTGASSISELLLKEEALTSSAVSSGVVRNLLSVDNMLIAPYRYLRDSIYTHERYLSESGTNPNSYRAGLMSFNNWYTMLTGKYKSGNTIRLKLGVPMKGLEYIDLSLPIILAKTEAKMYTLENDPFPDVTLPYKNYASYECQYGTDILYLLDNLNGDVQTIALENGYIEVKYDKVHAGTESHSAWVYTIFHNKKGLTYVSGQLGSVSKTASNDGFGENRGLYLMCPPRYASSNPSSWGNMVGELTAPYLYEYPNAPLCFFSEVYGRPYSSTGITYKGTSGEALIPFFTTNYRTIAGSSVSDSLASYTAAYATNLEAIDRAWWKSFLSGSLPRKEINIGKGSIGGGISGGGGGNGGFNDDSEEDTGGGIFKDNTPTPVIPDDISKIPEDFVINVGKMYTLLYMDDSGVAQLANALWTDSFTDYIKKKFAVMDPSSIVMSIKLLPYFPSISKNNLVLNNLGGFALDTPITCKQAHSYTSYDAGNIDLGVSDNEKNAGKYFGDFLDFTNTRIQLFLPFLGDVELSTSDVMYRKINLKASFDNMAGMVVYMLTDAENGNMIGSWTAKCTIDIPLTSGDFTGKIDSMIQAAVGAGAMALTAGASSLAFAGTVTETTAVMSAAGAITQSSITKEGEFFKDNKNTPSNALNQSSKVIGNALGTRPGGSTSSSYGGIAGVLSHLKPFLRITRNKAPRPANYKNIQGYPSNMTVTLSECEGYTEVNAVHLEKMGNATEAEIAEIVSLLQDGVVF